MKTPLALSSPLVSLTLPLPGAAPALAGPIPRWGDTSSGQTGNDFITIAEGGRHRLALRFVSTPPHLVPPQLLAAPVGHRTHRLASVAETVGIVV